MNLILILVVMSLVLGKQMLFYFFIYLLLFFPAAYDSRFCTTMITLYPNQSIYICVMAQW